MIKLAQADDISTTRFKIDLLLQSFSIQIVIVLILDFQDLLFFRFSE